MNRLYSTLLISGLIFFNCVYSSMGAVYYFSSTGDDHNKGTTPGSPKKSLAAASELALPGNKLLFKRGDSWYAPFKSFNLSNKAGTKGKPIEIDAWGTGEKPVIASLILLDDSGWRRTEGTNTWRHDVYGFSKTLRLFVDGVSKYKVNTSREADENSVDQPYEWFIREGVINQNGLVYVNTGSPEKAPKNVEILPAGAQSALIMHQTNYVTVRNIDFRGGSQGNIVQVEAPSSNITFDNCIIQRGNGGGLQAYHSTRGDLSAYVSQLNILNCLIDKVWSDYENDPAITLSGDGIFLLHAVDGGIIRGNKILNWGHSGISVTSYALGVHGVHRMLVEQNDVSAGVSAYTHAIDMNGFAGLTTHNIIRCNYFHDYTVTGHILGSYNQIYSNIFAGIKVTKMPRHSHQGWGVDWYVWQFKGDGPWMEAHDNYLVNNTFTDAEEVSVMLEDFPENPEAVSKNVIANNIFYNFGKLGVNVGNNVRGTIHILNNNFWHGNGNGAVVRYKSADNLLNAADLNKAFPQFCKENTQFNPLFTDASNRDYHLTEKSPAELRSGGTPQYSSFFGKGFVDYYGNKWDPNHPSIGAIQYNSKNQ